MYIHPFLAGISATILVELLIIIVAAVIDTRRKK